MNLIIKYMFCDRPIRLLWAKLYQFSMITPLVKHFEQIPLEATERFRPIEAWVIVWIGTSGLHVACPALFALGIFPASPDEYAFVGFFVLEFGDRDSAFPVDDSGITDM